MKINKSLPILLLMVLSLLYLSATSCSSLGSGGIAQPDLMITSMSQSIIGTATAEADRGDQALINLMTAEARATATTFAIRETQSARAASVDINQYATATVGAPILAELPFYNVDPQMGYVGWMTDTQTLMVDKYHETKSVTAPVTAADFVLASDITWDTQYGSSGCGFIFRADGDLNTPNAYLFIISRFASGRGVFTALAEGELANIHDFFPKDSDHSFDATNGSTNRIAVVARGNLIEIYSNTIKIAEIDTNQPPSINTVPRAPTQPLDGAGADAWDSYEAAMEEYSDIVETMQTQYAIAVVNFEEGPAVYTNGFVGLNALSESGRTECTFSDTWLWIIQP